MAVVITIAVIIVIDIVQLMALILIMLLFHHAQLTFQQLQEQCVEQGGEVAGFV